jgi:hypothetical protein
MQEYCCNSKVNFVTFHMKFGKMAMPHALINWDQPPLTQASCQQFNLWGRCLEEKYNGSRTMLRLQKWTFVEAPKSNNVCSLALWGNYETLIWKWNLCNHWVDVEFQERWYLTQKDIGHVSHPVLACKPGVGDLSNLTYKEN